MKKAIFYILTAVFLVLSLHLLFTGEKITSFRVFRYFTEQLPNTINVDITSIANLFNEFHSDVLFNTGIEFIDNILNFFVGYYNGVLVVFKFISYFFTAIIDIVVAPFALLLFIVTPVGL